MISYRISEYDSKIYKQKFNYVVPEFKFDDDKKCLIKVGEIDLQEQLNSHKDSCLENILQKFLNPELINNDVVRINPNRLKPDLATLGDIYEKADEYREKYNLSLDDYPDVESVFRKVDLLAKENANSLQNKISKKEGVLNGKKKENFSEEIQEIIPQDSGQSPQEKS